MTDYKLAEGWLEAGEAAASISGTQLLFVCGAVKSGTTWVQHWLNENPEIDCRGEAHLFTDFADGLVKLCDTQNRRIEGLNQLKRDGIPHFPTISSGLAQRLMRETVIGCLAAYDVGPEIKVLGEKTPTSSVAVGMILSLFPDAKILNVIRDGRDMVVSTWHHNLRSNREGFLKTFPTFDDFLPEIARIWVGHQTPLLELGENTAVRRIHYEDLLADPAPVVFGVFDWLDVAADEETVAACVEATSFEVLSGGRKRGQADPDSFYRVGTERQWESEMTEAQQDVFWGIAGETMLAQGYDRSGRIR